MYRQLVAVVAALVAFAGPATAQDLGAPQDTGPGRSRIVILGDGTPTITADRSGTSAGIVVRGTLYIFDAGPGVIRRIFEAKQRLKNVSIERYGPTFITHLHSDHTLGLPELLYYAHPPHQPFRVYGPPGLANMMTHILAAYSEDRTIRTTGLEHADTMRWGVRTTEVTSGVVYQDSNIKVTAFEVLHGSWPHALGYRIDAPDRSIVLSGDTRPSDAVVNACNGCDVLLHEVSADYAGEPGWNTYNHQFHTTPAQLGEIARRAHPKLLVMFHQVFEGSTRVDFLREVGATFNGPTVSARDLDVY